MAGSFDKESPEVTRPPWETCEHCQGVGSMVVYVFPSCPHMGMVMGRMIAEKSDCRRCGRKNGDRRGIK